jgi:hypothetical protein
MRFASDRHWWTHDALGGRHSLEGRLLPLLPVGAILVMLILSAWRFEPAENLAAGEPPTTERTPANVHQLPAVHIRLVADSAGHLSAIALNGRPIRDTAQLRDEIKTFRGAMTDATVEAEVDCDGKLRYDDTRQVVAAISSYRTGNNGASVPLVDRIKFLPRRGKP